MALNANALLTMAEGRDALGKVTGDQNARVEALINAVSDRLDSETGRRLGTTTYTALRVSGGDQGWLLAPEWPITTLTTVAIAGTAQTVWVPGDSGEPSEKDVYLDGELTDPKHTRWRLYRFGGWPLGVGNISLTFTAGYGVAGFPVPDDLKECARLMLRHFYFLDQRQSDGVASRSIQGESVSYIDTALPTQAWPTIRAYKRWSVG